MKAEDFIETDIKRRLRTGMIDAINNHMEPRLKSEIKRRIRSVTWTVKKQTFHKQVDDAIDGMIDDGFIEEMAIAILDESKMIDNIVENVIKRAKDRGLIICSV